MTENYVEKRMLIAPSELDGFAGAVTAFMVLRGKKMQIAAASVYRDRAPRVDYAVPAQLPYPDVPELTRLLAEFAERVAEAVELAKA